MAQANWRRVRTRYPGSQTITACVYMYNYKLEQYRGGVTAARHRTRIPSARTSALRAS